jgi:predicted dehydrogenase
VIATAAVRGTGSIGARHLRVLRSVGVERLVAVPVRPGRTSSPELGDALIAPEVPEGADLVVVATDTARHVADTVDALDRGAGVVLVEKPLAPQTADAVALLDHPRRGRVRVCAPLRFHEGLDAARSAASRLSGSRSVRIVSQSWLPGWRPARDYRESYSARPGEGGVLRDLVHEIDYALWLFGRPVALQGTRSPEPSPVLGLSVDESADLLWRTADGVDVSVRVDYVTRPGRRSMLVTSPDGSVRWDALTAVLETTTADGAAHVSEYPQDLDRDVVLARQARALVDLCLGRASEKLLDLDTALAAVRIGERVRETSTSHSSEFA